MVKTELSKRQEQVLDFIVAYTGKHGYPPSVRDIGTKVGLKSSSTVHSHLVGLENKGYIRRDPSSARAIEVLRTAGGAFAEANGSDVVDKSTALDEVRDVSAILRNIVTLPVVGRVAAGQPILAEQNIEDSFALPTQIVGDTGSFMLTIHGNSMIEAGINDGDYVVVREQNNADNGDIVVAMIDDEATVKTFYREPDCIRLQPQNSSMQPIYSREVQIIGKVIALLRTL
jgi:repressor LexA